jgi:uncharacterized protein YigA (DUF484 family)
MTHARAPQDDGPARDTPDPSEVRALLLSRPELLRDDPELLDALGLRLSDNVVEFAPAALSRLEAAREAELTARQMVEAVAEANFIAQAQSQATVLDLLESRNNADLAARLDRAARERFQLLGAGLAVEGPEPAPAGWRLLPPDGADALVGEGAAARLGVIPLADMLFTGSALPGSTALIRIEPWPGRTGVLAFASADPDGFAPDMSAELIAHLARVVERISARWPVL